MAQQLGLAVPLYLWCGFGLVLWGVSLRVAVSFFGQWLVGHFAHRRGHQGWRILGLPIQGFNLPGLGLLTIEKTGTATTTPFLIPRDGG